MDGFRALLVEGVFYKTDSRLLCASDRGVVDVNAMLSPLQGQRVRLAAHHLPPNPPDPTKWGGGCCLWEQTGRCPAGHHARPTWLFNLSHEGILVQDGATWVVESFDGTRTPFRLEEMLVGHQARVAAATVLDLEKMRDALGAAGGSDEVESLVERANDLHDLLSRIRGGEKK